MKRLIMLLLCALVLLCACGNENVPEQPAAEPTEQVADATEPTFHDRSHTLTEIRHRPPSEEEDGNYLYYRCNDCGALFWDFTGRTPATLEEVIVPALGRKPFEYHDYDGDNYDISRLYSFYGHVAQGGAIFEETFFVCDKYGYCYMYDLGDGSLIAQFPLGSFNNSDTPFQNHSNQMMFGAQRFSPDDPFPLLYVTTGYSNDHDETGAYYCKGSVERILYKEGRGWYAEVVQTIEINDAENIPDGDINGTLTQMYQDGKFPYVSGNGYDAAAGYEKIGYGWPHFYVDSDPTPASMGKLFIFSARWRGSESWEKQNHEKYDFTDYVTDNAYIFTVFDLPALPASESAEDGYGQTVTLYPRDIIDQFTTEFDVFAFQGGTMYQGRIYHSFGDAKQTAKHTNNIRVWDVAQRRIVARLDLHDSIMADWEPECCCIYRGELALSTYNMDANNKIVNLYVFGYVTADEAEKPECLLCGDDMS